MGAIGAKGFLLKKTKGGRKMSSLKKKSVVFSFMITFLLALVGPSLAAESLKGLPPMMTWSAYDIGSRGYVQAAAISNALTKQYGTKVRILPSGTSVGRLMPMKTGAATYGFLADEVYFAAEAIEEFLAPSWGPQDLRVMLAHPAPSAVFTTAKSGIKKMQDLRGKRVPWVVAASSLNVKLEAYLAFGGLTWKDVQVVEVPSYAASLKGVTEGKLCSMNSKRPPRGSTG
jgi:TRAP transporter TAXI family solute receptor